MRAQSIAALIVSAMTFGLASAKFHYGIETCNEAQGGYYKSGIFVPASDDNCLAADNAYEPASAIAPNATHPTGKVCGHTVTIDFEALVWFNAAGTRSGTCSRTNATSTCSPPYASCTWEDSLVCKGLC